MCFFCGLDVSMPIISLGLCGFTVSFPVLGQAPISGDVQKLLKLDREAQILVQSCQCMY